VQVAACASAAAGNAQPALRAAGQELHSQAAAGAGAAAGRRRGTRAVPVGVRVNPWQPAAPFPWANKRDHQLRKDREALGLPPL